MELKERIKIIRKNSGKTQEQFGKEIGVSKMSVTYYESGTRTPDQSKLKLMCEKFNINEEWLLTGEGDMHAPLTREAEIAQIAADLFKNREEYPYIVDVVKLLQKMDKSQWDVLFNVARQLTDIQDKYEDKEKGAE